MKLIDVSTPTFPNTYARVDDADFDDLCRYTWTASRPQNVTYAIRRVCRSGRQSTVRMHREILSVESQIDHRDGDGLNNQRENLRACTNRQNAQARRKKCGRSPFRGVSWHQSTEKWRATIVINGRTHSLGYFTCPGCAAVRYDEIARRAFGEFACPNSYS